MALKILKGQLPQTITSLIWRRCMSESSSPASCKVALITGGSIGIGLAFAKSLLQCGAKGVMLGDIRDKEGQEAACHLTKEYGKNKVLFMKCDVTKTDDLKNLFKCTKEKFGGLDIVINNAGLLQDNFWSLEIDVNVKGLVAGTILGFEHMGKHKKGKGGIIVNVSSVCGLETAWPFPVYNGTKAFTVRFSHAMSNEYYEKMTGVKVFTICPGGTNTNMVQESSKYGLEGFGDLGKKAAELFASVPSQPAEACGACLMKILCADENGSIFVVDDNECYKVKLPDRQSLRVRD